MKHRFSFLLFILAILLILSFPSPALAQISGGPATGGGGGISANTATNIANGVGKNATNFVLATSAAANPSAAYWAIAGILTTNSFCAPFTCPSWLYGFIPGIAPLVLIDGSGNYLLDANRGSGDVGWFLFSYPSNATAVTFSATVSSYNGNATTLGFGLKAWDNGSAYNYNSAWAIPASGSTNITVTYSTYQDLLAAAIIPADAVTLSNLKLTFAGVTNLATSLANFRRYEVMPSYVTHSAFVGNIQRGNRDNLQSFPGPDTVVSFTTTSPFATLEFYNGTVNGEASIFLNGQFLRTVSFADQGKYQYVDVLLGTNLPVRVDVVHDYGVNDLELALRSISVPSTNAVILMNRRPQRRVFAYGDSILSPGNEAYTTIGTLSKQIERMLDAEVALYSTGGRQLYQDWSTDVKRAQLVKSSAAYQPSDVLVEIGRNDWYYTTYATTNLWAADYAAMVDSIHNANPGASFYLLSPTVNANETTNSAGATPTAGNLFSDFRLCIKGIALARSNWCAFIDGPSLLSTGDLADGIHPGSIGNPKLGWQLAKAMYYYPTNTAAVTPYGSLAGNGLAITNLSTTNLVGTLQAIDASAATNLPIRRFWSDSGGYSNVTTREDIWWTNSAGIPANLMANNGDVIEFMFNGSASNAVATTNFKFGIAGTNVKSVVGESLAASSEFEIFARLVRTNTTGGILYWKVTSGTLIKEGPAGIAVAPTWTANNSVALSLAVTSSSGTNGMLVGSGGFATYYRNSNSSQ